MNYSLDMDQDLAPPVTRLILYVKDVPKVAAFYQRHFNMVELSGATVGWLELASPNGGIILCLHQAAKSQKSGAAIKITFAVHDVAAFKKAQENRGLKLSAIHDAGTHQFANAKDPNGNSISISSRGLNSSGI
jgi:predicted enzyme related to lactoylglutathione lyase